MPLPQIQQPLLDITIPSTDKKIKIRPMVVREEKILLMAKAAADSGESNILPAIKQVVNNCIVPQIDVDQLTVFDLEYLFVKLRAHSVNNIAKVSFRDIEDEKVREFEIDLNKLEIKWPEKINPSIEVKGTNVVIQMKYPRAALYDNADIVNAENADEQLELLATNSIDKVFMGDTVVDAEHVSSEERKEFIESLDLATYEKVKEFFASQPRLYHKIEYTNANGKERVIELQQLSDFFTLD